MAEKKTLSQLQPSKLQSQRELMVKDLDLRGLKLAHRNRASYPIEDRIISGTVNRTIDGASTVTIVINDNDRALRRSGMLGSNVDIKIDGLWFRLVKVSKSGKNFTLTFEDREVAVLRTYKGKKTAAWGKTSRTRFAKSMIDEVKQVKIAFYCPELTPPKKGSKTTQAEREYTRDYGFGAWVPTNSNPMGSRLLIKGVPADKGQLQNVQEVLDAGRARLLKRKLLVCAVMTIIVESSANNVPWGDRDSVGLFQQRESWGTFQERMDPTIAANKFYDRAVTVDQGNPNMDYGALCQAVQVSAFPERYAKHRTEAERLVTAYGLAGNDIASDKQTANANNMSEWATQAVEYQFTRGTPKTLPGGRKGWSQEDSWECLGRLADEVGWRRFMVSGTLYFISETKLFQSAPRARLSEDSDGVDWIDYDYDTGKDGASVTITCRIDRWDAPPGSTIEIFDNGPVNGRWIVSEVERGFFSDSARITCKKPRPKLPEPEKENLTGLWDNPWTGLTDPNAKEIMPESFGDFALPFPEGTKVRVIADPSGHSTRAFGNWQSDDAYDLAVPQGTPVLAVEDATVTRVNLANQGVHTGAVFGAQVTIEGHSKIDWFYTHIEGVTVREGQKVKKGEQIGVVTVWFANTFNTHLHLASTDVANLRQLVKEMEKQ